MMRRTVPSTSAHVLRWISLFLVLALISSVSSSVASPPSPPDPLSDPALVSKLLSAPIILDGGVGRASKHPKLDSAMAQLALAAHESRERALRLAGTESLRVMEGRVQTQITTRPEGVKSALQAIADAGGEVTGVGYGDTLIQAWLPVDMLETVATNEDVLYIRRPVEDYVDGPVDLTAFTSEGLAPMNVPAWHAAGYRGAGVRVGVLDLGFKGYPTLLGTELPSSVTIKNFVDGETDAQVNGTTEHGTACAEIIHDIAPNASLYLIKYQTMMDKAEALDWMLAQGINIISTSTNSFYGPGDGTGDAADVVHAAHNAGVLWINSAGNYREGHWRGDFTDANGDGWQDFPLEGNLYFVNIFVLNGQLFRIPAGYTMQVFMRWSDWSAVNQDLDLYLVRWNNSSQAWQALAKSNEPQQGEAGQVPFEYCQAQTVGDDTYYGIAIQNYNGSVTRGVNIDVFVPNFLPFYQTVYDHSLGVPADCADAITVAALDVNAPYPQEYYSSEGPTNGLGGVATGGFTKPDISAFANVSTASYGSGENKFNGTSSACPHVAGAAALVLGAYPQDSPDDVYAFLTGRAIDMGSPGMDTKFGYGRVYLGNPPSSATNTPTLTRTPTRTLTPTRTNTPTVTQTPTRTRTPTPTSRYSPTPTITRTPTHTRVPGVLSYAYLPAILKPPRPTITPTPTRTYTPLPPTATPTPNTPVLLYWDDFANTASGWPVQEDSQWRIGYQDGEYQIKIKAKNLLGWVTRYNAESYAVEVDGRFASSVYGSYGLVFGVNASGDQYYFFTIDESQYYTLRKYQGGSMSTLIDWTQSSALNAGQAKNRLRVERYGTGIALYANGQHLASVDDGSLTGARRIGLFAAAFGNVPVDVRFDNIAVYAPPLGTGVTEVRTDAQTASMEGLAP